MLGTAYWRIARLAAAVCLAVLLSFASLAPLAAEGSAACSCCRSHGKCCCRKDGARTPVGPTLSSACCSRDCGLAVLGGVAANVLVRPSTSSAEAPTGTFSRLFTSQFIPQGRGADDVGRQRPPPDPFLA